MGFGVGQPDLAAYRLIKGGDSGLNLRLSDLYDKEIVLPSLRELIKSIFTGKRVKMIVKAYPVSLIKRLEQVQLEVDELIKREIEKAKRQSK